MKWLKLTIIYLIVIATLAGLGLIYFSFIHKIIELEVKAIAIIQLTKDLNTTKIKQSIPGEALIFSNCVPNPLQVKVTKSNPKIQKIVGGISELCKKSKGRF